MSKKNITLESIDKKIDVLCADFGKLSKTVCALSDDHKNLDKKIESYIHAIVERFDSIDQRFESMDLKFESIDRRFDRVEHRLYGMDRRFDDMDVRFDEFAVMLRQGFMEIKKNPYSDLLDEE